ncbi:MlaD family protein [Nocardia sp. NPDC051832]|uniref:MlaD family protein n=1 Tax=Nocardia sp. NPDC051832 TaxID=3155673 RepID=UPI003439D24E
MTSVRGALVRLAIFGVIIAVFGSIIVAALRPTVPGDKLAYTAVFTDVSGLYAGDDVRMAGVAVGTVLSVDLDNGAAEVRFAVLGDRPIFGDTIAAVRYQNLLGQRYVELEQQNSAGSRLPAGAVIPLERTIASFDVSDLFNGFQPMFQTLDADALNRLGENMLRVLNGDGAGIGPVLADLDTLTRYARNRESVIILLIHNLGQISDQIGGKSAQVGELVKQLTALVAQFSGKADQLVDTAITTNKTLRPLVALLEQGQAAYDDSYLPLDAMLRRLTPHTDQLTDILALMPGLLTGLNNALPGQQRAYDCSRGQAEIPGIGAVVLGNQGLVICR